MKSKEIHCTISLIIVFFMIFYSCTSHSDDISEVDNQEFISAVDLSSYPEIETYNPTFYDSDGLPKNMLLILKSKGINTIRLRLWVEPSDVHSGFEEVKQFSQTLQNLGFKIWLSLHYSDSWADPSQQNIPTNWQHISDNSLKDSVYAYTKKVVLQIKPNYIQIGNEINNGFLLPKGSISTNLVLCKELLQKGISAVRDHDPNAKIILHYAGIEHSEWFFSQVQSLDYDIIGLSYYPIWHGKDLNLVQQKMEYLQNQFGKKLLIAETAYPFTLQWNDFTNNVVGLESQIIVPEFPATAEGQRQFVRKIKQITQDVHGIGMCYWGSELIAYKGTQSTDASPWENQALFDFQNKVLPALGELSE